jgi:aerobic carbon-monoxide dehydrogenase large subunit
VKLLKHWCVEDCGTVINPQLVDEQIRGGIVQGIGGAMTEHCLYSSDGQLLKGTMADYLVPMTGEMPDRIVGHVVTPTRTAEFGDYTCNTLLHFGRMHSGYARRFWNWAITKRRMP